MLDLINEYADYMKIVYLVIMKEGYVYILTNKNRTVLYTGVTNNIWRRVLEHKSGLGSVFTKKYNLSYLMYYEEFNSIGDAIVREKQVKNWHRKWKINLIKETNPSLDDLASAWFTEEEIQDFRETQDYI